MTYSPRIALLALVMSLVIAPDPARAQAPAPEQATTHSLPFPDFHYRGSVGRTIEESDPPQFPQPVRPPKGALNIVLILIDDAGYGQFGTFGGQVRSEKCRSTWRLR